jgi:ketosteroid isomerase-like protein
VADERIEMVHRAMEAIGNRDLDALLELVTPDFSLQTLVTVWPQTYVGADGMREWMRDLGEVWDEFVPEPGESRDLGDGVILLEFTWHGRGRGASAELTGAAASLWRFEGDSPSSARIFPDAGKAMRALEPDA